MKDIITKLFNLEQRMIHDIEMIHVGNEVFAIISLRKCLCKCPICGTFTDLVHDYRKRTINHAILNDVHTHLVYNRRRYRCPSCGKVFAESNPFVTPSKNISTSSAIRIFDSYEFL